MIFVDYNFTLHEDGSIEMDYELSAEKLNLKNGDLFKAEIIDNKVVFKKQPPRMIWEQD